MIKAVALDLDGVVYSGETALPGAVEAIERLRRLGLQVWFVTNNSARPRVSIAAKLRRFGVAASESEVMTSGYAAGLLLRRLSPGKSARVVVVGSDELRAMIEAQGFEAASEGPAQFLVVGMDLSFNYDRIRAAMEAILGGAVFVACNRDATYPVEGGRLLPGCGPMVAAIECASGRAADHVVGKPSPALLELVAAAGGLSPGEILVVGDTPESDIAAARHFGSPSVLVGDPAATAANVDSDGSQRPDFAVGSLAGVPGILARSPNGRST
ncbi:HAD-IIA family hydrolase [candidate division WOR-3 bacterium]|uniref:HAD-IIA family hydrolase n=1 Tax=candidate division WOR-3 bacterium TaxID=2052148 RepID=A0A937XFS1_UNCW3|nr:HAD-IIA family hydrolase [candidate division WOR-3 bacterium]